MGLAALIGAKVEDRAEDLVRRALELALSPDDATAKAGLQLLWDRHLGRPISRTEDVTPELPADIEALRSLSPDERRAMLRSLG